MTHAEDIRHDNGSHQRSDIIFDEDGSVTLRRGFFGRPAFVAGGSAQRLGRVTV